MKISSPRSWQYFAAGFLLLSLAGHDSREALGHEDPGQATAGGRQVLVSDKLANAPGNTFTALTLDVPPGEKTPSHHHAGYVFAYVLDGTVRSGLNGGAFVEYHAGQSWTEPPGTQHTYFENPSESEPARLLVVFVAPDGAQLTRMNAH